MPGIREYCPPIEIGDRLLLRCLEKFPNVVMEAAVVRVLRPRGLLYVDIPNLIPTLGPATSYMCHVEFTPNVRQVDAQLHVVREVDQLLKANPHSALRDWLLPANETSSTSSSVSPVSGLERPDPLWFDDSLNIEQKMSVKNILRRDRPFASVPFIVHGGPGTGKTKTVIEAVLQCLAADPQHNVLLCAPSDSAADTLAMRLHRFMGSERFRNSSRFSMLRLQSPSRTFAEVPEELMLYCNIEQDEFTGDHSLIS